MGIYRTYFDKSNTLISGSEINTSRNEIIQLYYGLGYTRHIFKINLDSVTDLYKKIMVDSEKSIIKNIKHTIKFKNTSNFDINPLIEDYQHLQFSGRKRATSFDLELHQVTEEWDEGDGYGYELPLNNNSDDKEYVKDVSNWYNRNSVSGWTYEGAVSNNSTAIDTAHLDRGCEDIEFDVTDVITNILTGATNNGFCLKFPYSLEQTSLGEEQYVGFFSKETNTFFEPYLETTYDDTVKDDRNNFIEGKDNTLVFYANLGGNFTNLDTPPTGVTINGVSDTFDVEHIAKGVYQTVIPASAITSLDTFVHYRDTWSPIIFNGNNYNYSGKFIINPQEEFFQFGNDEDTKAKLYKFGVSGINYGEEITKSEIRRITIRVSSINNSVNSFVDNLDYKLYTLQGSSHVDVIDWEPVNIAPNSNYLLLDTTWLIPQTYYIDFKFSINNEVKYYNKKIKFTIINKYNDK